MSKRHKYKPEDRVAPFGSWCLKKRRTRCGICCRSLKGKFVEEKRPSGHEGRMQVWRYHPECWQNRMKDEPQQDWIWERRERWGRMLKL